MSDLNALLELDFKYIISGIILFLIVLKSVWTLVEWLFVTKLGIETKKQRKQREAQIQLDQTTELAKQTAKNLSALEKQHSKDEKEFRIKLNQHMEESKKDRRALHEEMRVYSENRIQDREQSLKIQKELTTSMSKLSELFVDKQISDYRWEIINLADKISQGKSVGKECFKHAIATHAKYEAIIEEHGLKNGEVEISMEIINKAYKELLSKTQ